MSQYETQRKHLGEWAGQHIVECDALATGLLQHPFSTVFFGDRKALRFGGSLPDGKAQLPYTFYFYPSGGKPGVSVTDIKGNIFAPPYIIVTPFDKPGVVTGIVVLRLETDETGKRFIVTDIDCKTPDGTKYSGIYYLFTLPPRPRPLVEGGDVQETTEDNLPIGFLPVVV